MSYNEDFYDDSDFNSRYSFDDEYDDYDEDEEKVSDIYSEVVESLIKYKVIPTDEDSIPENKLINLCE